jgi:hypothetical protein
MTLFIRHYFLSLQLFTFIPITVRLVQWVCFSPAMLHSWLCHRYKDESSLCMFYKGYVPIWHI